MFAIASTRRTVHGSAPLAVAALVALALVALGGCASSVRTRFLQARDYRVSVRHLRAGQTDAALRDFPQHAERSKFITTLEQAYLQLLRGRGTHPALTRLAAFSRQIDRRLRVSVSRELKTFFYAQTPGGYFASEHEIILMHMFMSWGYSLRHDYENGCVEARKSSALLSGKWSPQGRFDDPFLRGFLGVLWTMCGQWRAAQVEFRAAYHLKGRLGWARRLGYLRRAPRRLVWIFGGTGPEPVWKPRFNANPLRGMRSLGFRFASRRSKLRLRYGRRGRIWMARTPSGRWWYRRHQERDNAIHELIKDSHYALDAMVAATDTVVSLSGVVLTYFVLGPALGAAVIYAGVEANSEELAAAGLALIIASMKKGVDETERVYADRKRKATAALDRSGTYRFARFLPEYAWLTWTNRKLVRPLRLERQVTRMRSYRSRRYRVKSWQPITLTAVPAGHTGQARRRTEVILGFYPDTRTRSRR